MYIVAKYLRKQKLRLWQVRVITWHEFPEKHNSLRGWLLFTIWRMPGGKNKHDSNGTGFSVDND